VADTGEARRAGVLTEALVRILVVEDMQPLAGAIANGLRGQAMAVDVVFDGEAAQEKLTVNDYDVVVLDRDLQVVHGDEVCRSLVSRGAAVRILMLTAAGDLADRVAALNLGADNYLAKPFAFTELVARSGRWDGGRGRPSHRSWNALGSGSIRPAMSSATRHRSKRCPARDTGSLENRPRVPVEPAEHHESAPPKPTRTRTRIRVRRIG
jgi:CheY-like chemotaxis protein